MRSKTGVALAVAAALLLALGFLCMAGVGDNLQYVLPAPQTLSQAYEQAQRLLSGMGETVSTPAVAARAQGVSIQNAQNGEAAEATVYAVGEGYFDFAHVTLLEGRLLSPYDIANAQPVVLLDSGAALRLFRGDSPIGGSVTIGAQAYRVVGVVAGGRRTGETDEHVACIPVTAAQDMDTLEIAARGSGAAAAAIFESTLRAWQGGGTFYFYEKLKMGAWLPLRWVLVLLAARLAAACLRGIVRYAKGSARTFGERLKHSYAGALMPFALLRMMLGAAMCAGLAALLWGIALAAAQPLYMFGEWVPGVFVELSSLEQTFWNLNDLNAAGVRYMSRDACVMELARGLIRWGTLCALLGAVCGRRKAREESA